MKVISSILLSLAIIFLLFGSPKALAQASGGNKITPMLNLMLLNSPSKFQFSFRNSLSHTGMEVCMFVEDDDGIEGFGIEYSTGASRLHGVPSQTSMACFSDSSLSLGTTVNVHIEDDAGNRIETPLLISSSPEADHPSIVQNISFLGVSQIERAIKLKVTDANLISSILVGGETFFGNNSSSIEITTLDSYRVGSRIPVVINDASGFRIKYVVEVLSSTNTSDRTGSIFLYQIVNSTSDTRRAFVNAFDLDGIARLQIGNDVFTSPNSSSFFSLNRYSANFSSPQDVLIVITDAKGNKTTIQLPI